MCQIIGLSLLEVANRGKSGLHKDTVPVNDWRR